MTTPDNGTTTTPETTPAQRSTKPRKTGKKAPAKASPVKAKATGKADGKTPLKVICGAMKIEPKAARRKLRASELAFHAKRDRWNFTAAQATRVKEILASLKSN